MGKINITKVVNACEAKEYSANLKAAIDELQSLDLEVDVKHSMSQANKGFGYMYSAVVIGREK